MPFTIIAENCNGCSACEKRCPTGAISGLSKKVYYIEAAMCIDCGACVPVCPVSAIFALDDLPEKWKEYTERNAKYFGR